jgi:hypothetical protein
MNQEVDPRYREAYKKVLLRAVSDQAFRNLLLGGNKQAAQGAIAEVLGSEDADLSGKIVNMIYDGPSGFRTYNADSKSLIKMMAFVFDSLPQAPKGARPKSLVEYFESQQDWEVL